MKNILKTNEICYCLGGNSKLREGNFPLVIIKQLTVVGYRLRAINIAENCSCILNDTIELMTAPQNFQVTVVKGSLVSFSWSHVSNATVSEKRHWLRVILHV